MQQTAVRVPFTTANVSKCMCPKCPVQTKSQCSKEKMKTIKDALKAKPLNREAIPGVYCSTGTAICTDLDLKKPCICGSCAVYGEYKLFGFKPVEYYCRDGSAK